MTDKEELEVFMADWNTLLPIELKGTLVKLVPLNLSHADNLKEAISDGQLNNLWYTNIPSEEGIDAEIERRLQLEKLGSMAPFAIIQLAKNKAVGMTTFMNMDPINRRLEIGSTWYRKEVQRTLINTECKLMLMSYAFERLDCICVEFRTHFMNHQSRRGIERLGAKLDGILRSNAIQKNGSIRDTAVYSIIKNEWSSVRANLEFQISKER